MLLCYFKSLGFSPATTIFSFPFPTPSLLGVCKFWVILSACRKMCSRNILTLLPFLPVFRSDRKTFTICHEFCEVCLFMACLTPLVQAQDFTYSSFYLFQVVVLSAQRRKLLCVLFPHALSFQW